MISLKPAIAIMKSLKYPQKFLLISTFFCLPVVLMMYLLITEINSGVKVAQQELKGTIYLRSLTKLWDQTLKGKVDIQRQTSSSPQTQIKALLEELQTIDKDLENNLNTREKFNNLQTAVKKLSFIDNKQNTFIYEQILSEIEKLRLYIGDTSSLILDPDLNSYYLMDTALIRLPDIQEILAEIESIGLKTLTSGEVLSEEKFRLTQLSVLLSDQRETLIRNVNTAIKDSRYANLSSQAFKDLDNLGNNLRQIINDLDQITKNNQKFSLATIEFTKNTKEQTFQFGEKSLFKLDILLNDRINNFRQKQLLVSLFVIVILLIVIYLFIGFYKSVMQTIRSLEIAAKRMINGNAGTLEIINIDTKDELGIVVNSFNRIAVVLVEAIAAAQDSEIKYRSIFENAIDGIFQTSLSGAYISVNPSLVKMYGYSSEAELMAGCKDVGKNLYVDPKRRQDFVDLMALDHQVVKFESEVYCQNGTKIWISEDARAVMNAEGNIIYYEGLVRDISDRIAAEKSLLQANLAIGILNQQLKSENMRMSAELSISRKLQQMILPREQELSKIKELDISGYMEPASEVGGDYYDILVEDGGRIKIGIGDVTGHGLESSVLMIMVQTAVRTLLVHNETDPVRFLNTLNRTIYDNVQRMESGKNLSLALIDYEAGKLTISGQHEEMIIVRKTGAVERIDTIDLGFPIGLEPYISDFIHKTELQLHPQDVAVLYTDGVTEAENPSKEQYGLDRLCATIQDHIHGTAQDIRQAVINNLRSHIGTQEVFDDITLLVIKQR